MLDQIKKKNIQQIMLCLMARRRATKAEIVEDTRLSTSTVSSCVNSLLKLELLAVDGMEHSSGGRRSTIYRLNRGYGHFLGLELCPGLVRGVAADCEAQVLRRFSLPIERGEFAINVLTAALRRELDQDPAVLGIGVGVSADLDYAEQIVLSAPDQGWRFVHLKEILERQFMVFTHLEHPVNAAALYHGLLGRARGQRDFLYLSEEAGEKAALVLDGRLCRGADSRAGRVDGLDLCRFFSSGGLQFLGVAQLLVDYRTEPFKERLCAAVSGFSGRVDCVRQAPDVFPLGVAVAAQRQWFESIYFML